MSSRNYISKRSRFYVLFVEAISILKVALDKKRVKHYLMLLYQNCVRNPNRFRTIISKAPLQISNTKSAGNFIDCICSWTSYQWVINQGDYIIVTFLTHKIKLDNFILVSQYLLSFFFLKSYLSSSTLSFQFILTYLLSLPPTCLLNPNLFVWGCFIHSFGALRLPKKWPFPFDSGTQLLHIISHFTLFNVEPLPANKAGWSICPYDKYLLYIHSACRIELCAVKKK